MYRIDGAAVCRILADLDLAPSNRQLADYWLSLCDEGRIPSRTMIKPSALRSLLPNLILFDVVPDQSVTVRLAGTTFGAVLGVDLTGRDWVAMAPENYRARRLSIFSDIATGAIGHGIRFVELDYPRDYSCEEFMLPFRAEAGTGTCAVVCHVDWNLKSDFMPFRSREQVMGAALAFETIPLPRLMAAQAALG